MKNRKIFRIIILLLLPALFLTACGGSTNTSSKYLTIYKVPKIDENNFEVKDKNGNIVYTKNCIIQKCDASAVNINIPEKINGYKVIGIQNGCFWQCNSLESVTIPKTVTQINEGIFYECPKLTSVTVSQDNPVYDSRDNCNAIIETATNTLVSGSDATVIPSTVTSIVSCAFLGCNSMTSLHIPARVTSIDSDALVGCSSLLTITVDQNNPVYDSRDNCNAIIETATNTLVEGCKKTTIPEGITKIGDFAFDGQRYLLHLNLPDSLKVIGKHAFYKCTGLMSMELPEGFEMLDDWAFSYCSSLGSLYIPKGIKSFGLNVDYLCDSLQLVYYGGTREDFPDITRYIKAVRFYSETKPESNLASYWHYLNGKRTIWY